MYFDGTFSCVPSPFYQCLIVMIFADRENKYIPCAWILLTGKTKACYMEAISWVGRCLPFGRKPNACFIGVDFEIAFFTAAGLVFPKAFLVGCFFHFKQANRKKMITLGMEAVVVDVILLILDYAPSLPKDDIIKKGVPYLKWLVRNYLKKNRSLNKICKDSWRCYWKYFEE